MKSNPERYRVSRIVFWVGAAVALALRMTTGGTTWPLVIILASVAVGLFVDLVIRKA